MAAGIVVAITDQVVHPKLAHGGPGECLVITTILLNLGHHSFCRRF
jgi:hypothetical protein